MHEAGIQDSSSPQDQITLFFSAAGQRLSHGYRWQSESGLPIPSILDTLSEVYIDNREISWVVQRSQNAFLLILRNLPSSKIDPGLRQLKNGFALDIPVGEEGWLRSIMIELLRNEAEFSATVDSLVQMDNENAQFGWFFNFDRFRALLNNLREKYPIETTENDGERGCYRFSSREERSLLAEKLLRMSLPDQLWITICNPIVEEEVFELPIWALVTDTKPLPKSRVKPKRDPKSYDPQSTNVTSDEVALVVIAAAALIVLWLLMRRK